MDILADEDIDRPIVEILRSEDFDLLHVDEEMKGARDSEVIEKSRDTGRIILTFDSDFVETGEKHPGVIRITRPDSYSLVAETVIQFLESIEKQEIRNTTVQLSPVSGDKR